MLRLYKALSVTPTATRSFSASSLVAKNKSQERGIRSRELLSSPDLIALFTGEFSVANNVMHVLDTKMRLLGFGKCNYKLHPDVDNDTIVLHQDLDKERLTFLIILALRFPGLYEFAQTYKQVVYETLAHSGKESSPFFAKLGEKFNITIDHPHLKNGEVLPTPGHLGMQQFRRFIEARFGKEIYIESYRPEELNQAEKIKERLKSEQGNPFVSFETFKIKNYIDEQKAEEAKLVEITAVDKSAEIRRIML